MANREGRFAVALHSIERRALNEAFDYCNGQPDLDGYDRTALNRWLAGAVPARRDFVRRLAQRLDRDEVFQAWLDSIDDSTSADVKTVVTRFKGLTPEDKVEAFRQLREDLVSTSHRIRSNFTMRVELHDGNQEGAYHLVMAMNWDGYLPGNAKTVIVTDYDRLADAFHQQDCVFRDVVELDEELLEQALVADYRSEQTLSYTAIGTNSKPVTHEAMAFDRGMYEFPNDEVELARVLLRVTYPFPHGVAIYPIVFQGYQIAGPARITLAIHSKRARNPRGYAFLGSGRSWGASKLLRNELVIDAGTQGAILGDETGIVLHWSEIDEG